MTNATHRDHLQYFCTYFDQNYLSRGLALHESLRRHCPSFRLWVLCMDEPTFVTLQHLDLPGVRLISRNEFECGDAPLLAAKANRSAVEYYFTCTPSLVRFVLHRHEDVDILAYVDADLFFFSDLKPLRGELGDRSVGIIGHRFTPAMRHLEFYGLYNVGLLLFRRDRDGLQCLEWWRDRCNEWCYSRAEDGRFGDQKYLDDWPTRFRGVAVLTHKGANVAVWNIGNYSVALRDGGVFVDEQPLICFHYHGLKAVRRWLIDLHASAYHVAFNDAAMHGIFAPYISALFHAEQTLQRVAARDKSVATVHRAGCARRSLGGIRAIVGHILRRDYAVVMRGSVLPVPGVIAAHFQHRHERGNVVVPAAGTAGQPNP